MMNQCVVPAVRKHGLLVRSQSAAPSLLRFSAIFDQVDSIGQGFADEIFRVFKHQHPEVDVKVRNASDDVQYMIRRVRGS